MDRRHTKQTRLAYNEASSKQNEDKESERSHSGTEDTENEFPSLVGKTYDMVDDPLTDNIICWAEDGNGFVVKDAYAFCVKILPTYFRTKRFRSFVRNLNMYGFRSRKQAQEGVYRFKHPQFRRGKKNLLSRIRKKTTQKSILSDLRGAIKELRQNYTKLARSHARMEGVLAQISQLVPINMLQQTTKQLGNAQNNSSSGKMPMVQVLDQKASSSRAPPTRPSPLVGSLGQSQGSSEVTALKVEDNYFGSPAPSISPPFSFDGAQSIFGWSLLNPQA
uniref:Putative heat shock transcription factor n=1 Tax=Gymnochlora stellata TaxID=67809 RepID=B5A4L7_GYMST|nr:putative heat shock transcription factor [Gymnochlora stellata]